MTRKRKPDPATKIRISRTAKGERPRNFEDPAIDRLVGIALSLASELSVARDRLDAIERLLEARGLLSQAEIDGFEPDEAARAERASARAAFVERVLQSVNRELEELETGRVARPLEEIVADYAARRI